MKVVTDCSWSSRAVFHGNVFVIATTEIGLGASSKERFRVRYRQEQIWTKLIG